MCFEDRVDILNMQIQACWCGGEPLEGFGKDSVLNLVWGARTPSLLSVCRHNRRIYLFFLETFSLFWRDTGLNSALTTSIENNWMLLKRKEHSGSGALSCLQSVLILKEWKWGYRVFTSLILCLFLSSVLNRTVNQKCSAPLIIVWDTEMHINSLNWSRP